MIQFALVVLLFITLPLWDRMTKNVSKSDDLKEVEKESKTVLTQETTENVTPLQVKCVKLALISFLFYLWC